MSATVDEPELASDPNLPPTAVPPERLRARWTLPKILLWVAIALLGGVAWTMLAIVRGETVNAIWFVFAAVCTYLIGYRFYSKVIERYITRPNDRRATPAEYKADGKDYVRTDRNVLFGHHFAAIAGAGPLVGPVTDAQRSYRPVGSRRDSGGGLRLPHVQASAAGSAAGRSDEPCQHRRPIHPHRIGRQSVLEHFSLG